MCKFIGVEILAANALIEALENEKGSSVTFSKLEEYGIKNPLTSYNSVKDLFWI